MFKRFLSLALAVILVMSLGVIAISAAEVEIEDTEASGKIYFEVPGEWKNYKTIFCHIWEVGGDSFYSWQAKAERCVEESDGKWSYDLSALDKSKEVSGGMVADKKYAVIFSADTGVQTYDLLMGLPCIGDTAYGKETIMNPVDSEKTCVVARWKANGKDFYPVVQIDSLGNLVDPDNKGKENLDQTQPQEGDKKDDTKKDDTKKDDNKDTTKAPSVGGTPSGGSSGSGDAAKTGQSKTAVFISLGVMAMAACAVLVTARKKEKQ